MNKFAQKLQKENKIRAIERQYEEQKPYIEQIKTSLWYWDGKEMTPATPYWQIAIITLAVGIIIGHALVF